MSDNTKEESTEITGGEDEVQEACEAMYFPSIDFTFRNHLFEVIEELRVKRAIDKENEEKMKNLVAETHSLMSKHEEAEYKFMQLRDEKESEILLIKKEYELQLKNTQEEMVKNKNSLKSSLLEIKTLREEIRTLQMTKYSLEKKWSEQERKMALQNEAKTSNQVQITEIEDRCKGMSKQIANLVLAEEKLGKNVQEAKKLNSKLVSVNEHQKGELQDHLLETMELKKMLEAVKGQLSKQKIEFEHQLFTKKEENAVQKQQCKMTEMLLVEVKQSLKEQENQSEKIQASLKDAYALLSRHVDSIAMCETENKAIKQQASDAKSESSRLSKLLEEKESKLTKEEKKYTDDSEEWQAQELKLQSQLKRIREDYESLMGTYNNLEELNTTLSTSIKELQTELKEVKEKLNKPKIDAGTQVVQNVSNASIATEEIVTCEIAIQNACTNSSQETQTLITEYRISSTQVSINKLDKSVNTNNETTDVGIEQVVSEDQNKEKMKTTTEESVVQLGVSDSEPMLSLTVGDVPDSPHLIFSEPLEPSRTIISSLAATQHQGKERGNQKSTNEDIVERQVEKSTDEEKLLSPLSRFYGKMKAVSATKNKYSDETEKSLCKRRKVEDFQGVNNAIDKDNRGTAKLTFQFLSLPESTIDTIPQTPDDTDIPCQKLDVPLVGILSNISGVNVSKKKARKVTFAPENDVSADTNHTDSQHSTLDEEWRRINSVFEPHEKSDDRQNQREDEVIIMSDEESENLEATHPNSLARSRVKTDRLSLRKS